MGARLRDPDQWVSAVYNSSGDSDAEFGDIVRSMGDIEPNELADVIEADGFLRVKSGKDVELSRYLDGIPNLAQCAVAMDAAIEVCCRAAAMGGDSEPAAGLIRRYPELEPQIRRSEILARLFAQSTERPASRPSRALPCELGPVQSDGRCRYELRELLGFGSQGGVYLAVDRQLSEPDHPARVAGKILKGSSEERRVGK